MAASANTPLMSGNFGDLFTLPTLGALIEDGSTIAQGGAAGITPSGQVNTKGVNAVAAVAQSNGGLFEIAAVVLVVGIVALVLVSANQVTPNGGKFIVVALGIFVVYFIVTHSSQLSAPALPTSTATYTDAAGNTYSSSSAQ